MIKLLITDKKPISDKFDMILLTTAKKSNSNEEIQKEIFRLVPLIGEIMAFAPSVNSGAQK